MACISGRWYFITGHCPVCMLADLDQPKPMRMDKLPYLAASSTAPGSSVTYSPGMPIWPPSRTMPMQSLSTCAGCSGDWPSPPTAARASKPTQSTAASTVGEPVMAWILSSRVPSARTSIVSQPNDLACSSLSGIISPTMTHAAPSRLHEAAHASPTGPAPATYTIEPGPTPAVTAPWNPVGKMSDRSVKSAIFSIAWALSGNLSRLKSA
mmetsp:Transcript_19169/g.44067  ORF Transcript_19169/g.44067 Transcript_19169/m.44067 type:complete len:210 (-) Transcript_19169:711-1340(-)